MFNLFNVDLGPCRPYMIMFKLRFAINVLEDLIMLRHKTLEHPWSDKLRLCTLDIQISPE